MNVDDPSQAGSVAAMPVTPSTIRSGMSVSFSVSRKMRVISAFVPPPTITLVPLSGTKTAVAHLAIGLSFLI
jgi:hypothetical protein